MKNFIAQIKSFITLDVFLLLFFWGLFNLLYAQAAKATVENRLKEVELISKKI